MVVILWKWPISREKYTVNSKMSHLRVNFPDYYLRPLQSVHQHLVNHGIRHSTSFKSILVHFELVIFVGRAYSYSIHMSMSMTCSFATLEWATGIVGTSRFTEIRIIIFIVIWFWICSPLFSAFVDETISIHLAPMACGRGGKYAWKGQRTMIESI